MNPSQKNRDSRSSRNSTLSRGSSTSSMSHDHSSHPSSQGDGFPACYETDSCVSSNAGSSPRGGKRLQKKRRRAKAYDYTVDTDDEGFATELCGSADASAVSNVRSSLREPHWNGIAPSTPSPSVHSVKYDSRPVKRDMLPPTPLRRRTYALSEKPTRLQRMCARLPEFIQKRMAGSMERKFRKGRRERRRLLSPQVTSPAGFASPSVPPPPFEHSTGDFCHVVRPYAPTFPPKRNRLSKNKPKPVHWDGHCIS